MFTEFSIILFILFYRIKFLSAISPFGLHTTYHTYVLILMLLEPLLACQKIIATAIHELPRHNLQPRGEGETKSQIVMKQITIQSQYKSHIYIRK